MSYSVEVRVKDGTASVTTSGEVPEGSFTVAGHEDDSQSSLNVTRRLPDGRFAASAAHTHNKVV